MTYKSTTVMLIDSANDIVDFLQQKGGLNPNDYVLSLSSQKIVEIYPNPKPEFCSELYNIFGVKFSEDLFYDSENLQKKVCSLSKVSGTEIRPFIIYGDDGISKILARVNHPLAIRYEVDVSWANRSLDSIKWYYY